MLFRSYVADYITKTPLKTHVMFQSIEKVFERNAELLGGDRSAKDKARSLITKMVNALTAASEIGGPMASMYLLKHPDHYTSHQFRPCYWRGYVLEVMRAWNDSKDITQEGKATVVVDCEDVSENGPKRLWQYHQSLTTCTDHQNTSLLPYMTGLEDIIKGQSLNAKEKSALRPPWYP